MPLPTPNDKEKRSDFIARCMSSDIINKDFKDQKQKAAVCYSQYEKAKKKSKACVEFGEDEMLLIKSSEHYEEAEKEYDHEMTISKEAMEELHQKGETYITETDGDRKMIIKVKFSK